MIKGTEKRNKVYLILNCLILLLFFVGEWGSIMKSGYYIFSGSAALIPFQLFYLIFHYDWGFTPFGSAIYTSTVLSRFALYSLSFYVIPVLICIALVQLYVLKRQDGFIRFSKYGLYASLITAALYALVRMVYISSHIGGYPSLYDDYARENPLGLGYWLILIISTVAIVYQLAAQRASGRGKEAAPEFAEAATDSGNDKATETIGAPVPKTGTIQEAAPVQETVPEQEKETVTEQEMEAAADEAEAHEYDASEYVSDRNESIDSFNPPVTLKNGDRTLALYELPAVISRDTGMNNLVVGDESQGGRQCRILEYEGNIVINELDSTTGTWLNDEKLDPGSYFILQDGDRLKVGSTELDVSFDDMLVRRMIEKSQKYNGN